MKNRWEPEFTLDSEHYKQENYDGRCIVNLMEAVVERAIRDAIGTAYTERENIRDARKWLHSNDDCAWSFLWMAKELKLTSKFINRIRSKIPESSTLPLAHAYNGRTACFSESPKAPNFLRTSNGMHRVYRSGARPSY